MHPIPPIKNIPGFKVNVKPRDKNLAGDSGAKVHICSKTGTGELTLLATAAILTGPKPSKKLSTRQDCGIQMKFLMLILTYQQSS